ncbi:TPA: replication initiation factor domain-containing protein [Listeria monocytogenes]|nr:replication initiation factor domain-containing protein [Listeria monocytogenes]
MGGIRLNNELLWHEELKEKRLEYGFTQNRLAVYAGITRQYLSEIELGKMIPTEKVKLALLQALKRFNPNNPLEMLFDYVRIRFPTDDVVKVIQEILRLNIDYMIHEDYAYYSYQDHYHFGDIMVLHSLDLSKGVLLELKGKGCRQFENFLLAQHRSWYDFFLDCVNADGVMKRLDLAINDKNGVLDIPELAHKCDEEECISVFRNFKNYKSGELKRRNEKQDMGNTLYIGSLKSDVYFCIYEKDYEQFIKTGVPIEEAEIKNRFEIRLKNERAEKALEDLLFYRDPERTAFSIINRYIRFATKEENKRRNQWKDSASWAFFIGEYRTVLRLTTVPEPYDFKRTLNWLRHQVAPTLKIATILDTVNDTDVVDMMIREASLTDRHEKILEQQLYTAEDIIL